MRALVTLGALALLLGTSVASASPAAAWDPVDPVCVGSDGTVRLCADVNNPDVVTWTTYEDCVYLGGEDCTPVSVDVPIPGAPAGNTLVVTCRGAIDCDL